MGCCLTWLNPIWPHLSELSLCALKMYICYCLSTFVWAVSPSQNALFFLMTHSSNSTSFSVLLVGKLSATCNRKPNWNRLTYKNILLSQTVRSLKAGRTHVALFSSWTMASRTQVSAFSFLYHPQYNSWFSSWLQEGYNSSSHHILTKIQTQKSDHNFLVSVFKG